MFRDGTEMRNVTHYGAFALHTIHIHFTLFIYITLGIQGYISMDLKQKVITQQ
uniref:Uncharacterized protein n=1 Tax=Picea sitchensis TaxID=3332 RepID=D5AB36_PICSI|nr:unknown [Picea sitchensis]